ncbi:Mannose-6-phosphate isomerase [Oopsacas minuta]|uniref:Mannose-6-phosphate isomerase n=1 Tax=Oopsacas minuta TaxID=111878 RepID=A0AAV7JQ03_9METZ|nr:Mannose-6-phosphate isomerase [Oopsacas minuta]
MAEIATPVCKLLSIKPAVQNYAWGKLGASSAVAALYSLHSSEPVDADKPYAELWMGTHPKGANTIAGTGTLLSQHLTAIPSLLGSYQDKGPIGQLPFLFKVLSVHKPLSIQAHPNKTLAVELHSKQPDAYPDSNHKPELAIALTSFQALCGFRPLDQIRGNIEDNPELLAIVGADLLAALKTANSEQDCKASLKACFTKLFTTDLEVIKLQITALIARIETTAHPLKDLILYVQQHFPCDVGILCCFFLNHLTLQPGESIFLAANEPHAYLQGDCIECMACSDNVVRAGLTPKYIDKDTLCEMLSYICRPAVDNKFQPVMLPEMSFITVYDPPVPDFSVRSIAPPLPIKNFSLPSLQGPSILLVISGTASLKEQGTSEPINACKGSVLFVGGGTDVVFSDVIHPLVIYQGYY